MSASMAGPRPSTTPRAEPAPPESKAQAVPAQATEASSAGGALPGVLRVQARALLESHLWGVGLFDVVYLGIVYTLGTYTVLDAPSYGVVFTASWLLARSRDPSLRRLATVGMLVLVLAQVLSAIAFSLAPRYSSAEVGLRVAHLFLGRYVLPASAVWLVPHLRTPWPSSSPAPRAVARAGWLFLKLSLWTGILVGSLATYHQVIMFHVYPLAFALPLLTWHVAASFRGDSAAVRPFRLRAVLDPRWIAACVGCAAALVTVVALLLPQTYTGHNFRADPQAVVRSRGASFTPSRARTEDGVFYHAEALGQSASCVVSSCHPLIYQGWKDSRHRNSVSGPYEQELQATVASQGTAAGRICAGCHDPISLFAGSLEAGGDLVSATGRREGISCLVCHSLRPIGAAPANGSTVLRFPRNYNMVSHILPTMEIYLADHEADFAAPGWGDDRLCVACHRFDAAVPEPARSVVAATMRAPFHRQERMVPACRESGGCLRCHRRVNDSEKPFRPTSHHDFTAEPAPAAAGAEVGR